MHPTWKPESVLMLSRKVDECKPLMLGTSFLAQIGPGLAGAWAHYRLAGAYLVHFLAEPEPFLTLNTSPKRLNTPSTPALSTP